METGGDLMNWEKFFGVTIYNRLKAFCADRNMSLSSVIKAAVASYLERGV